MYSQSNSWDLGTQHHVQQDKKHKCSGAQSGWKQASRLTDYLPLYLEVKPQMSTAEMSVIIPQWTGKLRTQLRKIR